MTEPTHTANETITMTVRSGRLLSGWPLLAVCAVRNAVVGVALADGSVEEGVPQFAVLSDRGTGKRLARVGLGRDAADADAVRLVLEDDLSRLTRQEFLDKHAKHV